MYQYPGSAITQILLVEDNPGDVLIIKECFRDIGNPCELSVAKDGQEALDFLNKVGKYKDAKRPDLVLLDLNLPKVSGHEVLAYVKSSAAHKRIPVLVLSSSRSPADIQRAYELAANCYLCKPSSFEDFQRLINTLQVFWLEMVRFPNGGLGHPSPLT